MTSDDERPSAATRAAESQDATVTAGPDRAPTPEEEAAAPTGTDDAVGESYREMAERGADQQGEGRI